MILRRVRRECSNRCEFCAVEGGTPRAEAPTGRHVAFVGGEPSLAPDLEAQIEAARAGGASRITLQSNASHLGGRLAALVAAGLDGLELGLQGPEAVHDYLTGRAGSHAQILDALAEGQRIGLPVAVTTLLTRAGYRHLHELPPILAAHGVAAWRVVVPEVAGRLQETFARAYPRLALAMPHALRAISIAERDLPARIVGAPLCLMGPYADRSVRRNAGAFGPACAGCAARPSCDGVEPAYLTRFGGDELRARDAVTLRPDPEAWRFAGTGDAARGPRVA